MEKVFRTLSKYLADYNFTTVPRRKIKLTLLNHSLGNHVLENYIKLKSSNTTDIFDHVTLHEPDVDSKQHEEWVNKINPRANILITINRHDYVLTASGAFHQSRLNSSNINNRLGNNTSNFTSLKAQYVNFTGGIKVTNAHNLFFEVDNAVVVNFFAQIFKGNSPVATSLVFKESKTKANVFNLDQDFS